VTKLVLCLLGVAVLGLPWPAGAEVAEASHRLKKLYNFEDADDRGRKIGYSGQILPRNWYVIGRPALGESDTFHAFPLHRALESRLGYPHYADVGFDGGRHASGDFALKLDVVGGRTGAFVQHGAIQVNPGSDYRVSAKVNTHNLQHAWAELRAYFVDKEGRRIDASLRRSEPITAADEWVDASVKLTGDHPDAAFIGIEVHVIQPGMDPDDPIGDHQIVPSDIDGGAWFDDIAVWELPSVNLSTDSPTNIVVAPDKPKLHVRVRDLTGKRMQAVMRVYDHRYELVDELEEKIDLELRPWTPDLGERYGWYIAELRIYELDLNNRPTMEVARTICGFLWLSPDAYKGTEERRRFSLLAEDIPTDELPLLAELMKQAGLTGLVVSGWERLGTPKSTAVRARALEPIVRDLLVRQGGVAVSFWPVPVELAGRAGVDASDPLNVLTLPSEQWIDYAKPFLAPLGQRQTRWQVGSPSDPKAFLSRDLSGDLERARVGIRQVAPSPRLIAPWRLDQLSRGDAFPTSDAYAVAWSQGVEPEQLAETMADWPAPPRNVRLDIELADAIDMSHERRVADLMLRVLHAWEHQAEGVGLATPWTEAHERRAALTPDPVLGVYVNLARQLGGQRVIGRMPLGPGLEAMILDGVQGGMLAVWNPRSDEEPQDVSIYLGEAPIAVDPYGNAAPLKADDNGKHRLTVGQTPTIIRGIDPRLALLRAGFSLDEPFIESLQVIHRRTLRIHNPWPRTLNGVYTITGPEGWTIQPQRKHISIAAGDTAEIPVAMRFPIHEDGGDKSLTASLIFNAGDDYRVTLHAPMRLGLKGVEFDASVIVEPGKEPGTTDAIVTLNVTNTSDQRQSLRLFAGIQGHTRREPIIPGIAPGEFVSRRLRFRDIGQALGKYPVRCGVRESNGPAVLNKTLEMRGPKRVDSTPVGGEVSMDGEP
jgi:hypothetical protein